MGVTRWGIPKETVLKLSEQFKIDGFVETGTYKGETSLWASHHFNWVTTVEASKALYSVAKTNLSNNNKINLLFGNSKDALREIVKNLRGPALFWARCSLQRRTNFWFDRRVPADRGAERNQLF